MVILAVGLEILIVNQSLYYNNQTGEYWQGSSLPCHLELKALNLGLLKPEMGCKWALENLRAIVLQVLFQIICGI